MMSTNNSMEWDKAMEIVVATEECPMSFGCWDENELWALAIPNEDDEEEEDDVRKLSIQQDVILHSEKEHSVSELKQNNDDCELGLPPVDQDKMVLESQQQQPHMDCEHELVMPAEEVVFHSTIENTGSSPIADFEPKDRPNILPHDAIEKEPTSLGTRFCQGIKYAYSGALLVFCIVVVAAAIFYRQTTATGESNIHPIVAFAVFWFLILWLALMEGGLNCMVGLKPIDKELYAESHPLTHRCTRFAHRGNNLERFIVGRQFLDLSCVFLTSFMVSTIAGASVLNFPDILNMIFLEAGVAVILVTIVVGQLVSQINAAHCMLDYVNNYAMVVTTYAALTIEYSGLLHAVYLIQIVVSKMAGREIESAEPNRSLVSKTWFWFRVFLSTSLLLFALAACFSALFDGKTTMWEDVPAPASVAILVGLILIAGNMEALQIAMIAVVHLPEEELRKHTVAHRNRNMTFEGRNLQAFLVGRQILQTIIMFVVARITTLDISDQDANVFGVNDVLQNLFNTGILGALITTIIGSLSWRVLASNFPLAFLSSPFAYVTIKMCLFVEHTGVCSVAWLLASAQKRLAGYKSDEHHVAAVMAKRVQGQSMKCHDSVTAQSESS